MEMEDSVYEESTTVEQPQRCKRWTAESIKSNVPKDPGHWSGTDPVKSLLDRIRACAFIATSLDKEARSW